MEVYILTFVLISICNAAVIPVEEGPPEKQVVEESVFEQTTNNLFEGDIEISTNRAGVTSPDRLWTSPIPYAFEGSYDYLARKMVKESLDEISSRTCITFVERETETPYIYYKKSGGCSSGVGMTSGERSNINLSDDCMHARVLILHETLHALGFYHEQSRPDRDDFVTINEAYINPANAGNFQLNSVDSTTTDGLTYDYTSVMHYSAYAFTINSTVPTIVPIDSSITKIGRQQDFTPLDVMRLNKRYNCTQRTYDSEGYSEWTPWSNCDIDCKQYRRKYCDQESICDNVNTNYANSYQVETQTCADCMPGVNPDCGATYIESTSGAISSPLYPFNYGNSMTCITTIKVPDNLRVVVFFHSMDVEDWNGGCYYDYVYFYDGPDVSSAQHLTTICSTTTPDYLTSTGSYLTVKFQSDSSVNGKGFMATYYATDRPLFECWFENTFEDCGMVQDDNTIFNWTLTSGATPTGGTGPNADHPTDLELQMNSQESGGNYAFLETSGKNSGDSSRLLTESILGSQYGVCLSFWYHMQGVAMGTLEVQTVNDFGDSVTVWQHVGITVENRWYNQQLTITQHDRYKVGFNAIMGAYWSSDIAIDDIKIMEGPCAE